MHRAIWHNLLLLLVVISTVVCQPADSNERLPAVQPQPGEPQPGTPKPTEPSGGGGGEAPPAPQRNTTTAQLVPGNPEGVRFFARLPRENFTPLPSGPIRGGILVETDRGGLGAAYDVRFENLPEYGGPLRYHIHYLPVPPDGNCLETKAHLDPSERGEDPECDDKDPSSCQVGDLAGKYGIIDVGPGRNTFRRLFVDAFTATTRSYPPAYIGDRSFVIHFANKTRITCANFFQVRYNRRAASRIVDDVFEATEGEGQLFAGAEAGESSTDKLAMP